MHPTILSIITTKHCTAACSNCCFQCSPNEISRLSIDEIKLYINQAIENFDTLKILVLTGGECFTLGKDLEEAIKYSTSCNLKSRVVTNAYWANSYEKALSILTKLKEAGLSEINISTGDEHQEWIPYNSVVYASLAAVNLGLTVAISVEFHKENKFIESQILEDARLQEYIKNKKIIIQSSLWINFNDVNNCANGDDVNQEACKNLFSTISISSNSDMYACCGLTCMDMPYLKLGSLKKYPMKYLYNEQFDDLLKLWLYTHGPFAINKFLCEKKGNNDNSYNNSHMCSLCKNILKDKDNMLIIKDSIKDILPSVMLKMDIINNFKH